MKVHKLFNKVVAGMLSLALALGFMPTMFDTGRAYADTAAPSVSAYADKTVLTDDTFQPNEDGTATNIGKISFGGKAWYLLGGDGTNVDVFAAENFGKVYFQPTFSDNLTPDESLWATVTYNNGDKPSTVYCNNYSASNLRKTLQDLASGDTFNSVEKSMLPSDGIEVTTSDLKNKAEDGTTNLTYTTKDKLYAASAGDNVFTEWGTTIEVAGKKLNIASTYTSGNWFWLRSPSSDHYSDALVVLPGNYVSRSNVSYTYGGVLPASNLDFSSVLFASAAPTATSNTDKTNIDSDTMNLRLEATESTTVTKAQLGDASVNMTAGTITATLGTSSATLVVQGNDGTNDWYYTKALSAATTTVNANDIGDDVDLANCKIWLEQTGSDSMIYAVNATEAPVEYAITTSVTNGTITPSGETQVEQGEDLTVEYQPKVGYTLANIIVDGEQKSIEEYSTSYTFSNVDAAHSISVEFKPTQYSITYIGLWDAIVSGNPTSYTVESDTITLNSPTKTGYTFSGWTTDGVMTPTKDLKIEQGSTGNKTFAANWVINTYTVTFDDGSNTTKVPVDYGHKVTKPDDPTKDGYKFGGWFADQAYTTAWDFDEDIVTSDITLYAKWTKIDTGNAGTDSDNNDSDSSSTDGTDSNTNNSDSTPNTGDDTNIFVMIMLATLVALGATGVFYVRRRHS